MLGLDRNVTPISSVVTLCKYSSISLMVAGHFPNETSALVVVFSLLEEERLKWQKVGMRFEDITWIEEASRALEQGPIKLEFLEEVLLA